MYGIGFRVYVVRFGIINKIGATKHPGTRNQTEESTLIFCLSCYNLNKENKHSFIYQICNALNQVYTYENSGSVRTVLV